MKNLLVVCVVLLIAAAGGYWYWVNTPQYAVQQAASAVKAHDVQTFNKWVDVDSVSRTAVDDLMAEPVRKVGGMNLLARLLGLAVVSLFQPSIEATLSKQINTYVATVPAQKSANQAEELEDEVVEQPRTFLGKLAELVRPPSIREVFRDFGFTRKNYRGVGNVDRSEHTAHVGLKFFSPKANQEVQVMLELDNSSGHWRISRLANVQQICSILYAPCDLIRQLAEQKQTFYRSRKSLLGESQDKPSQVH